MNRLTTKNPNGKQLILKSGKVINHFSSLTDSWMICDKLGKLEDIEEELGCSLEVVFKALKEGIVVPEYDAWFPTVSLVKVKLSNIWCFECQATLHELKDYKKTWWLPEDEEGFKNE